VVFIFLLDPSPHLRNVSRITARLVSVALGVSGLYVLDIVRSSKLQRDHMIELGVL
jgi:hypothetical protein